MFSIPPMTVPEKVEIWMKRKQWINDIFHYKRRNSISKLDTTHLCKEEIEELGVLNSFVCNLQKMDPSFCYQIYEQSLYRVQGIGKRSFMPIYPIINTASRTISLPKSLNTFQSSLLLIIVMIPIKVWKA
jgi:hypothetical protein